MLNDLYSERLLTAAASVPPARRLDAPCATSTKVSRVCGSEVTVDLKTKDGIVVDAGLSAKACALGQASCGLVFEDLIGADITTFCTLRDRMRAMLQEAGAPPEGRFASLEALVAIRDYPQRHGSTLLVFEALCDCATQIENAKRSQSDE